MIPHLPFDQADFATLVQGPRYIYVDKPRMLAELLGISSHHFIAHDETMLPHVAIQVRLLSRSGPVIVGNRNCGGVVVKPLCD